MTPEIIARVDAWLASREAWLLEDDSRWILGQCWGFQVDVFGRVAAHERAGALASMMGILLALVRESWGDAGVYCERYMGADFDGWAVRPLMPWPAIATGETEAEALVAALEAAP